MLAALIKGYARAHASVRLLHAFKAFVFGLGVDSWFQWVPSKANIADLPSRGELDLLSQLGARERSIVFPPFPKWDEPALSWVYDGIASVRAAVVVQRRKRSRAARATG